WNLLIDLYLFFHTIGNLLQGEFDFYPQIGTALCSPTATSGTTAKEAFKRMSSSKDITKLAEYVFHVHTTATKTGCRISSMAKLIVALAFFRVTQDLISLSCFLEFLLGLLVTRVFVGMIFDGQLPVSRFNFCHFG